MDMARWTKGHGIDLSTASAQISPMTWSFLASVTSKTWGVFDGYRVFARQERWPLCEHRGQVLRELFRPVMNDAGWQLVLSAQVRYRHPVDEVAPQNDDLLRG